MRTTREPGTYEIPAEPGELPDLISFDGRGAFAPHSFLVLLRPEAWDVVVRGPLARDAGDGGSQGTDGDPRQWGWALWAGGLPERVRALVAAEALAEIDRLEALAQGLRAGAALLLPPRAKVRSRGTVR